MSLLTFQTRLPAMIFRNVVAEAAERHMFGGAHQGGAMSPKFELGGDFCTVQIPEISPSCV